MEQSQKETPVATTVDYRSNVDTSHPFSSVKDAVALFGKQSLVGKIYSPKTFTPSPRSMVKESSWKYSSPSPGVSSYSSTLLAETVNKLRIGLEETKVELKLLKERENEAEVCLASLKAKLARAEAAMVSAAPTESDASLALAQSSGDGLGRRKGRKLTKRKPIIPLIGDLLLRKKGSSSTLQSTSYAYMYWD